MAIKYLWKSKKLPNFAADLQPKFRWERAAFYQTTAAGGVEISSFA
jgi:hypothetical protein